MFHLQGSVVQTNAIRLDVCSFALDVQNVSGATENSAESGRPALFRGLPALPRQFGQQRVRCRGNQATGGPPETQIPGNREKYREFVPIRHAEIAPMIRGICFHTHGHTDDLRRMVNRT